MCAWAKEKAEERRGTNYFTCLFPPKKTRRVEKKKEASLMRARRQGISGNNLPSTCRPFLLSLKLYFLRVQRIEAKEGRPGTLRRKKMLSP